MPMRFKNSASTDMKYIYIYRVLFRSIFHVNAGIFEACRQVPNIRTCTRNKTDDDIYIQTQDIYV